MIKIDPITIITDSHYLDHDTGGADHPESPVRLEIIMDHLAKSPLYEHVTFVQPEIISRENLDLLLPIMIN